MKNEDYALEISGRIYRSLTLDECCILKILEPSFYNFSRRDYDYELSLKTIGVLTPLLEMSAIDEFKKEIREFINRNCEKITIILDERKNHIKLLRYLAGPELFLIFYLIENKPFILVAHWELAFPIEDLTKLFLWWGRPISDFHKDYE